MTDAAEVPFHPRKILLPTDFSPSACAALRVAEGLALKFEAAIYLLNVIPMLPIVADPDFPAQFFPAQEFLQDARKAATKRLDGLVTALASKNIKSEACVEIGNDVVKGIQAAIKHGHIDMLVISTHGMSGWRPMLFGSIAEKVVKLVECPLLLLRSSRSSL